jgi:hypothetical protein
MDRRTVIASAAAAGAAGLTPAGAAQGAPHDAAAWARGDSTFHFPGVASDDDAGIRASGPGEVVAGFIGFYRRHPEGKDAESIRWHQFDHMPEQFRLPGVRHGQRWVATPACRAARRANEAPYDQAVVSQHYLFAGPAPESIKAFTDLGAALTAAGRRPFSPPAVENVYYQTGERLGHAGSVVSVHALPWRPAIGVYVVVEQTGANEAERAVDAAARKELVKLDGVAGTWRFEPPAPDLGGDPRPRQAVSVYYLYQDPVAMAGPIGEALEKHWAATGRRAKLAGPFYVVRPLEWDRYLP